MGTALSHPRLFRRGRRDDGRAHSTGYGRARVRTISPVRSIFSATTPSMDATGARWRSAPSCTSRSVITRRSTMRSDTGTSASKLARRGSTSSRAATARSQPILCMNLPTRACRRPSPTISRASARLSPRASRTTKGPCPFGAIESLAAQPAARSAGRRKSASLAKLSRALGVTPATLRSRSFAISLSRAASEASRAPRKALEP